MAAKNTVAGIGANGSAAAANGYAAIEQAAVGATAPLTASRYGDVGQPAMSSASQIASTAPATPVVAASAQAYRPGGTSTYPGAGAVAVNSSATPQVAARTQATTSSPYSYGSVPNVATPTEAAQPAAPARY
jgi:hypothetical protein